MATRVRTMLRGEVFAATLAFRRGELADEVFIDASEEVFAAGRGEDVLREEIDEGGDVFAAEIGAGVDRRQQAVELVGGSVFEHRGCRRGGL